MSRNDWKMLAGGCAIWGGAVAFSLGFWYLIGAIVAVFA